MPLGDYQQQPFTHGPWTRPVYRRGHGPAVVVIHEIPGLHPLVTAFADRLVEGGMTVFMPSLFGTPDQRVSKGYTLASALRIICVRREFSLWADGRTSPIVEWLRALARHAHAECGGPGVGAVGMCLTGGFALAMATDPSVVAPVLAEPSLPLRGGRRGSIDIAPDELACVRRRVDAEGLTVLGLRYRSDRLVPDARFDRYARELGGGFARIDLEDADARQGTGTAPHSVLTVHLPDSGPGKDAERRTIDFFRERLGLQAATSNGTMAPDR